MPTSTFPPPSPNTSDTTISTTILLYSYKIHHMMRFLTNTRKVYIYAFYFRL